METPATTEKLNLGSCALLQANGPSNTTLIGEFLEGYPTELFDPAKVEKFALSTGDLTEVVRNLACAAALSGYGPDVAESALALFSSKRYGANALKLLNAQTQADTPNSQAAKEFLTQINGYLEGPGE